MEFSRLVRFAAVVGVLSLAGGRSAPASETFQPPPAPARTTGATAAPPLRICSFNIQFLGSSSRRDNASLARLLAPYDIVVVQELVAAPAKSPADLPKSRQNSAAFFREMTRRGFAYVMSISDTGRAGPLNNHSTATEWWVTFYRQSAVRPADDIPHGFLSSPLVRNDDFDRVPYAFGFRTTNGGADFVLISVHLNPDNARRRKREFAALWAWIAAERRLHPERDFIVLGDTNLQNQAELRANTPAGFVSLNDACVATNVNPRSPKPYDHVLFDARATTEIDRRFGFQVIDLIEEMRPRWREPAAYPGDPYEQNVFRFYYSDHNPVSFVMQVPGRDDD